MNLKSFSWKLAFISLVFGLFITYLFTGQMDWKKHGDCSNTQIRTAITSNIRQVACSGLEYGFPYEFISADSSLDVSDYLSESAEDQVMLGVSSSIGFNLWKFIANVIIWSVASFAALRVILTKLTPRAKRISEDEVS